MQSMSSVIFTILFAVVTAIMLASGGTSAEITDSHTANVPTSADALCVSPSSGVDEHDEGRFLRASDTATPEASEERIIIVKSFKPSRLRNYRLKLPDAHSSDPHRRRSAIASTAKSIQGRGKTKKMKHDTTPEGITNPQSDHLPRSTTNLNARGHSQAEHWEDSLINEALSKNEDPKKFAASLQAKVDPSRYSSKKAEEIITRYQQRYMENHLPEMIASRRWEIKKDRAAHAKASKKSSKKTTEAQDKQAAAEEAKHQPWIEIRNDFIAAKAKANVLAQKPILLELKEP